MAAKSFHLRALLKGWYKDVSSWRFKPKYFDLPIRENVVDIPTVEKNEASFRAAYEEFGAVIVRNVIAAEALSHLELLCAALFSIMDLKVKEASQGEARSDDPLREYVERYQKLQIIPDDVARTLLTTSYIGYDGYAKIAEIVRKPLEHGLNARLSFLTGKTTIRRQGTQGMATKAAFVPWHRDAHAVRTAEFGECFNCWVPLQSVGVTRPSLQIVLGSNKQLKSKAVDYEQNDSPDEIEVRETYGDERICTAILEPGDFMIFDHHTLHRTQDMGASYPTRISGELRFQFVG